MNVQIPLTGPAAVAPGPTPFAPPDPTAVAGARRPTAAVPPRRRRRWPWFVGGGIALLALFTVGMVVVSEQLLTHDLLSEDFSEGAGQFFEGANEDYSVSVVDGGYEIRVLVDDPVPARSFAWFARTASSVEMSADVTSVHDPRGNSFVGISCLDEPFDNNHGYSYVVASEGQALGRWDGQVDGKMLAETDVGADWSSAPLHLEIRCVPDGSSVVITGLIDGVEQITFTDPDGLSTFKTGGIEFMAEHAGDAATFDNVVAVVPGG